MADASETFRLDPAPSSVFSFLEWRESAEAIVDESTGRTLRVAGPTLHVRYRTSGAEFEHFPVSREEAQAIFNPGRAYDFSIGKAFNDLIRAVGKSSRQIKSGDRQSTKAQREQTEQRAGRRWLA